MRCQGMWVEHGYCLRREIAAAEVPQGAVLGDPKPRRLRLQLRSRMLGLARPVAVIGASVERL